MRNTENSETANRKKMPYSKQDLLEALLTLLKKRFPANAAYPLADRAFITAACVALTQELVSVLPKNLSG